MQRRNKMCATCIFRDAARDDVQQLAALPADHVPCHTDCPMGGDIQCRGHFEAQRKVSSQILLQHSRSEP
jgi:hypothetical protein